MLENRQEILTRFCCAAALLPLAFPCPELPVTAVLVCAIGTTVFLYRYRCMTNQAARLWYLLVNLLCLWINTGINLTSYHTCALLSLSVIGISAVLSLCGFGLCWKQRLQRLGAFFFPGLFLALIPYSLRYTETGSMLTALAIGIIVTEGVCSIIGAARPRTRHHTRAAYAFFLLWMAATSIAAGSTSIAAGSLDTQIHQDIRLIFGLFWPVTLPILVWGRKISDYFQTACGIRSMTALCILSALTALAPLGIISYACHLTAYFN